jgi:hypothetical protein
MAHQRTAHNSLIRAAPRRARGLTAASGIITHGLACEADEIVLRMQQLTRVRVHSDMLLNFLVHT